MCVAILKNFQHGNGYGIECDTNGRCPKCMCSGKRDAPTESAVDTKNVPTPSIYAWSKNEECTVGDSGKQKLPQTSERGNLAGFWIAEFKQHQVGVLQCSRMAKEMERISTRGLLGLARLVKASCSRVTIVSL